jgi:hypothetical protein
MAASAYRVTEIVGVSSESWDAAARAAVETEAVGGHEILPVDGHRKSPRAAAICPHGRPRISPPVLS